MKDSKAEKATDDKIEAKKETKKPTEIKQQKTVNKKMAALSETPLVVDLQIIAAETKPEIVPTDVESKNESIPVNKKAVKAWAKREAKELSKKKPVEVEIVIPTEADLIGQKEDPDLDKKQKQKIKVIKKNVKKAEEKVDKLKNKVKKAKKKEVKPSKIKALKEKLEKALKKFKVNVKKLKEEKKSD